VPSRKLARERKKKHECGPTSNGVGPTRKRDCAQRKKPDGLRTMSADARRTTRHARARTFVGGRRTKLSDALRRRGTLSRRRVSGRSEKGAHAWKPVIPRPHRRS